MPPPITTLAERVARDFGVPPRAVGAVLSLLDDGATVPFIARYRKEATGALDEVQIRAVAERAADLKTFEDRRAFVLRTIEAQGKLTAALRHRIAACTDRTELEDLYLPYKKKKKTKAAVALERGLGPLAERILAQPRQGDLEAEARSFVDPARGVADGKAALAGARDIAVDAVADHAEVRAYLREVIAKTGVLTSTAIKKRTAERTRFEDYYAFAEPIDSVPPHRYFAVARGEAEGVLRVKVEIDDERSLAEIRRRMGVRRGSPFAATLSEAVEEAYRRRLMPALTKEVRSRALERAEGASIDVFAENLLHLLLAPPFGARPILAIDPGIRTGCKCVALDRFGRVLQHETIFPFKGQKERPKAAQALVRLAKTHGAEAVAVGNGTGGRETEGLARTAFNVARLSIPVVSVSEAGASVYSASDLAREELGELDVTIRGAVSIGRRLQDPLSELVKIDPKSIGVGQYQHDVDAGRLGKKLGAVVESCVNRVGVELTTASPSLLRYVAGIGPKTAAAVVARRDDRGFTRRDDLLEVKGLGPKVYEQCAGFIRLRNSAHPLDASAVHPERYPVIERMADDLGMSLSDLVGNREAIRKIEIGRYVSGDLGEPTLNDILMELEKPGRDPRAEFEAPRFREDVQSLEDLEAGMNLEGVVTNVTAFGAFVDVGVHQDGLVHISQLADRFIEDPRQVVKVGDRVKVRVLEVDLERRRISLSRKQAP